MTGSCTYHVDEERFEAMLASASADARRRVQIVERRGAPRDHPVLVHLRETRYLKFYVLRRPGVVPPPPAEGTRSRGGALSCPPSRPRGCANAPAGEAVIPPSPPPGGASPLDTEDSAHGPQSRRLQPGGQPASARTPHCLRGAQSRLPTRRRGLPALLLPRDGRVLPAGRYPARALAVAGGMGAPLAGQRRGGARAARGRRLSLLSRPMGTALQRVRLAALRLPDVFLPPHSRPGAGTHRGGGPPLPAAGARRPGAGRRRLRPRAPSLLGPPRPARKSRAGGRCG